jgi:hypothetical protein
MTPDEAKALLLEARAYNDPDTTKRVDSLLANPAWFHSLAEFSNQTRNSTFDLIKDVCHIDISTIMKSPIWIIPDPTTGCYVHTSGSVASVVVNEGALQCLCFMVSFFVAEVAVAEMAANPALRADDRKNMLGFLGNARSLHLPLIARNVHQPTEFPDLRKFLGKTGMDQVALYLTLAEAFMLLHENAHIALNHITKPAGSSYSVFSVAVEEDLNLRKSQELEADAHAVAALPKAVRGLVAFGGIWFLQLVSYYEALFSRLSKSHPLAVNRQQTLLSLYGSEMDKGHKAVATEIIRFGQEMYTGVQQFAHYSDEEKLKILFRGANHVYARDMIQWFFDFNADFRVQLLLKAQLRKV